MYLYFIVSLFFTFKQNYFVYFLTIAIIFYKPTLNSFGFFFLYNTVFLASESRFDYLGFFFWYIRHLTIGSLSISISKSIIDPAFDYFKFIFKAGVLKYFIQTEWLSGRKHSSDFQVRRIGIVIEFFFVRHVMMVMVHQTNWISSPGRGRSRHRGRQPVRYSRLVGQMMLHFPQSVLFFAPLLSPLCPTVFKPHLKGTGQNIFNPRLIAQQLICIAIIV